MKLRMSIFLSWVLLSLAPIASAALFDGLVSDTDLLEEDIKTSEEEAKMMEEDFKTASESDLFPEQKTSGSVSSAGSSSASKAPSSVSVMIDGASIVLRDVPFDSWFALFVRDIADRGVISGYRDASGKPLGLFGPADNVTIEQMAKMALESADISLTECGGKKPVLNATAKGSWSEDYISCAEEKGFAVFSDGSVDVRKPATRAQVVVTVVQAFGVTLGAKKGNVFKDVNNSTEFASAIERAAADFIVAGYTDADGNPLGEFRPQNPVNRAEIAKILSLAIQVYAK